MGCNYYEVRPILLSTWLELPEWNQQSTKMDEPIAVVVEPKEEKKDTRSRKMLKLSIGLLIVASIALLLYAASEAYSLLM